VLEEEGTVTEGVLCAVGPEVGTALLLLLLLEVAVVTVDDVDRFRALDGTSDSFGVGSCSFSNLPMAGFCTTFKILISPSPGPSGTIVPDAARLPCPSRP
jgi:hypothetical protein